MAPIYAVLLSTVLLAGTGLGLEVTPGSSCATFCLDEGMDNGFDSASSSTNTSDVTCRDVDFASGEVGIKFQSCLECLQKSDKVNGTESDLHWFLYNLRYTLSSCLFSFPNELPNIVDSPCVTEYACGPMREPLTTGDLEAGDDDTYGYCATDDGVFERRQQWCVNCLRASADQAYLANFVVALRAGCEQTPEPGQILGLTGTPFTTGEFNVTEPPEDILERPEGAGSGTMTMGTIVGISVGVGLLLLGAVALFVVYWRRQKRLRNTPDAIYYDHRTTPDPFLPPEGGMTASLRSHSGQSNYKKDTIMTSGDYYDQVEKDLRSGKLNYNFDPRSKSRGPDSALPAHQAYIPQAMSRSTMSSLDAGSKPAPSSYVLQTYLSSAESPPLGTLQPPPASHSRESSMAGSNAVPPPPSHPPSQSRVQKPSVPSLILPSFGKLRLPKKYSPPSVVPPEGRASNESQGRNMSVSHPVLRDEPRFQDRPLGSGPVYAVDASRIEANKDISPDRANVPLRSGQSALYGI
ncbi:hypothetical protein S40293_05753 [Stachybotrys chartarum IBT 40293]|nr:hypothetical protein S40293_05753 [Stachybotrys chartarum IBT 40293]KFA78500.1 hypothetical protein S40288_01490 [Stachybotrys chartarum IBT 40288]